MRLRKSVRARWVEALRSGRYTQARGVLTEVTGPGKVIGHCCLGVLCELAREDAVPLGTGVRYDERHVQGGFGFEGVFVRTYDDHIALPPSAVVVWAGAGNTQWSVKSGGSLGTTILLPDVNDEGLSFEEIADLIENDLDAVYDTDD